MSASSELSVFVSYRRSDSPASARQIADALSARFGAGQVFFDTRDLAPGTDWHRDIEDRIRSSDVTVVVIGPRWVTMADERGRRRVVAPEEEDVVRSEIEAAVRSGRRLVPVLVDDAVVPPREALPRPFRPITALNAVTLRHASWERDVEAFLDELASPLPVVSIRATSAVAAPPAVHSGRGGPPDSQYRRAAKALSRGALVPVIGAEDHDLARALNERFGTGSTSTDLAEVAQLIRAAEGPKPLDRALRELLAQTREPGPLHHSLARLPALLRANDCDAYPLLVTTTYDTALERAFEQAGEPFDLAVYIAGGKDRGRFLHIPWYSIEERGEGPITRPNEYVEFPVDDYGDLSRPIIVKVHGGAIHDAPPGLNAANGFVVTEDDYIAFLAESPVENLVPAQLLTKLRESNFLFLGYGVREWNLRVFLRRVWNDGQPGATSWAVQAGDDELDDDFWRTLEVERFDLSPVDYLATLERSLQG